MEFLVQTEENLAVEISGNYQSLMEQQKAHEVVSWWVRKRSCCYYRAVLYFDLLFSSYSKRRCSAGSRSCTLLLAMDRRCWSRVRWMTGKTLSYWIEDPPSIHPLIAFPLFPAPAGTSSTWNWLCWVTSGRASCGELSRGGASSTVWFASGSATERWWRSCAGGWWRSPTLPRPCRPGPPCLCSKPAPCSTLSRYPSQ